MIFLRFLFTAGTTPACKDFSTFILHHEPAKFISVGQCTNEFVDGENDNYE